MHRISGTEHNGRPKKCAIQRKRTTVATFHGIGDNDLSRILLDVRFNDDEAEDDGFKVGMKFR